MTTQKHRDFTVAELKQLISYDPATGIFTTLVSRSNRAKAGQQTGSTIPSGYIVIGVLGRNYRAHRLAWLYMTGAWPQGEIDHRNRIKSDNRWDNLREATHKQNGENLPLSKRSTSGFRGVSWNANCHKWTAHIMHNHRSICLGLFPDIDNAKQARLDAESKYFTHSENLANPDK